MKKRSIYSFKTWEQAEEQELKTIRETSPEERMVILNELIEFQNELPKGEILPMVEKVPVIYRSKIK